MKKIIMLLLAALSFSAILSAKEKKDSAALILEAQQMFVDSIESALKYTTGKIPLTGGFANLNVPEGFKYLNAEQSNYVLTKLWGNPEQTGVLGMLFPANGGPFSDSSYAFVITYDEAGFVKDDDADDINYDDMMKEIQKGEAEENKERIAQGYESVNIVGWATKPFYDKTNKVLHWAKNIQFGKQDVNTLNYEVRILGRKGYLSLNAVSTMNELDLVKKDIDKVLKMPSFNEGLAYKNFDSKADKVAAWTIGGLVAGKILLKVGFWAIIGKFFIAAWKFILIGIVAVWGTIKKFFGKKSAEPEETGVV